MLGFACRVDGGRGLTTACEFRDARGSERRTFESVRPAEREPSVLRKNDRLLTRWPPPPNRVGDPIAGSTKSDRVEEPGIRRILHLPSPKPLHRFTLVMSATAGPRLSSPDCSHRALITGCGYVGHRS